MFRDALTIAQVRRATEALLALVAEAAETRYARNGDVSIAYQVVGDAPFDVVQINEWSLPLEARWEQPALVRPLSDAGRDRHGARPPRRLPDRRSGRRSAAPTTRVNPATHPLAAHTHGVSPIPLSRRTDRRPHRATAYGIAWLRV